MKVISSLLFMIISINSIYAEDVNIDIFSTKKLKHWNYAVYCWKPDGSKRITKEIYKPIIEKTHDKDFFKSGKGAIHIKFDQNSNTKYPNLSLILLKYVGKRADWNKQYLSFDIYKKNGSGSFRLYAYSKGGDELELSKGHVRINKEGTTQYKFSLAKFPGNFFRNLRFVFAGNFDIGISNMRLTEHSKITIYEQTEKEKRAEVIQEINPPIKKKGDSDEIVYFSMPYHQRGSQHDTHKGKMQSLEIYAAKNEYEPVVLLMRSGKKYDNLKINLAGDFLKKEKRISRANCNIRIVHPYSHWVNDYKYVKYPFALIPEKNFSIMPYVTKRIWITMYVPKTAEAGVYKNKILIKSAGNLIKEIPLNLNVYNFTLGSIDASEKRFFIFSAPWEVPSGCDNEKYLLQYYKNMKEHGLNSLHVRALPDRPLEKDMEPAKKVGFNNGDFIWAGARLMRDKKELGTITEKVRNYGFKMFFYGVDEPNEPKKVKETKLVVPVMKKRFPNITVLAALDDVAIELAGDYYDEWVVLAPKNTTEIMNLAKKKKKIVSGYECALASIDNLTVRHLWGFYNWKGNFEGMSHWVFGRDIRNRFNKKQVNDGKFHPEYDYMYDMVLLNKEGIVDSVGWENLREGIDDYRYISKLEKVIKNAKNKNSKNVFAAQKLLSDLSKKIDINNYSKAYYDAKKIKNRRRAYAYERKSPEPNLSIADYDNYRRKIAQAIEKINNEK